MTNAEQRTGTRHERSSLMTFGQPHPGNEPVTAWTG